MKLLQRATVLSALLALSLVSQHVSPAHAKKAKEDKKVQVEEVTTTVAATEAANNDAAAATSTTTSSSTLDSKSGKDPEDKDKSGSYYTEGLPENAPLDANKSSAAKAAKAGKTAKSSGAKLDDVNVDDVDAREESVVSLDDLKELLELGFDEVTIDADDEVEEATCDAADEATNQDGINGGACLDYSMDGASSHVELVATEPKQASDNDDHDEDGEEVDPLTVDPNLVTDVNIQDAYDDSIYNQDSTEDAESDDADADDTGEYLSTEQQLAEQELLAMIMVNGTDPTMEDDVEDTTRQRQRNRYYARNRQLLNGKFVRLGRNDRVELPEIMKDKNTRTNTAKLLDQQEQDNGGHRRLQNLNTRTIGTFQPLSCNLPSLPSSNSCETSPTGLLSALVAAANGGEVIVPCGTCYKYDLPTGTDSTIGGLNIIGKLYVPPNYKSTLYTPYVFVQGELEMSDTNPSIGPEHTSMRIVLTGMTNVVFAPADSNADVAGTPFDAGVKPFLVAGGQVSIKGWDEENNNGASSWAPLLAMAEGARPNFNITETNSAKALAMPIQRATTTRTCPRQIVNDNFDYAIDYSIWSGGDGAIVSHDPVEGALVVENIEKRWQGPKLDFTKYVEDCPLLQDTTYLITMRIKVDKEGSEGEDMPCGITGDTWNDCMRLTRKILSKVGSDRYRDARMNKGLVGKYGEWFTFSTSWTYDADDLTDNVAGHIYYIQQTEIGTKVSLDHFTLELPSEKSLPAAHDPCNELVVNGDAENTDGNGFSYYPMWSSRQYDWDPNIQTETLSDGSINKFYRATNRRWHSDTIRTTLLNECFVKGLVYTISLKLRIKLDVPVSYYVQLKGRRADGGWNHMQPLYCPEQSQDQGWVTCSGPVVIDEKYEEIAQDLEFEIILDWRKDNGPIWAVVDYDDISMSFTSGPAEGLNIDAAVASRWGANSEVHITSSTLDNRDSQNAIIESVRTNADGSATIKLQSGIDAVISERDAPGQGVEVALLTRNIKVEGTEEQGGYFQVFHTPGVAQTIEGVEFINMGQVMGKNRFPIQFLYSGDVTGTSVSRNTIRNSNFRCIVIEGTSNAKIAANVAYDTAGHCFWFGHESTDNLVKHNLGSRTNNKIHWGINLSGHNDPQMATFNLLSHRNMYIGNVAAGSDYRGFYMYNDWRTLGEDLVDTQKGNLRRLAMNTFKDNKSHSNSRQGFGLYDFEQFFTYRDNVNVPVFENCMAYRNQNHGIETNNIGSAEFRGGLIADNQWGLSIQRSDGLLIQDMEIKGYTDIIKDFTMASNRVKLCRYDSWTHDGLSMMATRWRYGETDQGDGLRMKNVTFSDFDKNTDGCSKSWPIATESHRYFDTHFDYISSWENVQISDTRGYMMDGCRAEGFGFNDIVINDLNGSLDPSGSSSGPSAFVSNFPHMTKMFGGKCTEYADNCMAYCTDVCLRTFSYRVEQFGTENWKLRITNSNGDSMDIPGLIDAGNSIQFSDAWKYMKFSASLPAGTFTAQFIDEVGNQVWPTFVEELWENPPDCAGYVSQADVTILKPEVDGPSCDELVRNGGQDATLSTSDPWLHTRDGVAVGVGLGIDGSDAIVTTNRKYHWTGIGQNLDTRCINLMKGQLFEFSAWMRMTDKDGNPASNIDPNEYWWRNLSPIMTLNARQYRDEATKSYLYTTEDRDKVFMSRPYKPDGWNLIHGIFRMPLGSPRIFWELERAPDNVEFRVDDVSLTPFACTPDELLKNGNLEDESNTSKYWDTWGETVKLDIVPGYGGGNALKAFQRPHYSHGQAQVISTDCLKAGDRLAFKARIKFESNDIATTCNPYTWNSAERCSDMLMYTTKDNVREYRRVGWITTDDPVDGWYQVTGVYTLNENQAQADYAKIYFDGTATTRDVIVDDVQVNRIPDTCDNLVLNPSFEEGSAYWSYIDRGYSKVALVPGAGGDSDFALRSYDRNVYGPSEWRGVRQQLDTRCFLSGNEYTIAAKFRLFNSTNHGVSCDTNLQYNSNTRMQCPSVVIYGWGCEGGDVYWRFHSNLDWNPDTFNDFEADFIVTDQLASCETVHLYVHQVNRDWDIVMDDVQISAAGTESPTPAPSPSPTVTDLSSILTDSPTDSITLMPTVLTVTECPADGSPSSEIPAGPFMLGRSSSLCILTKAVIDANGILSKIAPVARSYDGNPWEKSAGDFATMLLHGIEFGEYTVGSQITLPPLDGDEKYYLTSYSYSISDDENSVARLLETATFGTTSGDLSAWDKGAVTKETAAQWIEEQMNKPITSHREFYRARTNPRFTDPMSVGRSDHPCDGLSRWRKFAFSKKDGGLWWLPQMFEARFKPGDSYITIKLNGHVRTVVESLAFHNAGYTLEYNKEYPMCNYPHEKVGGSFWLRMSDNSCQSLTNPPVAFYNDSTQPPQIVNLPAISESLTLIDELRSNGGEYIFFDGLSDPVCSTLSDVTEAKDAPVFGKLPDGSWLQYDPRLILEGNTPDAPIEDGGGLIRSLTGGDTRCANAPRTFLNEDLCSLSYSSMACGSSGTPELEIELNAENIAILHNITGQYPYGILGLPVVDFQGTELESPCTVGIRSRWEIKDSADCNHSALDTETNKTLVELLVKSSDSNPFVRDIIFPTRGYSCSASDTLSLAEVELVVGDFCYKRVHPDHMSVYDFTYWTLEMTHPGNMIAAMEGEYNPITKWMDLDGNAFLTFPSFPQNDVPNHPMERWITHGPKFPKLGRFGDSVLFMDLPNELRLDEVADFFGESSDIGGSGIVVCGSPNESANSPALGYQFDITTGRDTEWGLDRQREYIWAMIGLQSEDQLRQRVAWAFSQLLVVARGAISIQSSHTEAFLTYYDIFVRNAFGNYGDILREISYSPLMAENLSFLQSKSAAYMWETQGKISFADENFAREIMQLFSTGLYLLNLDGTPKLDGSGQPMLVYTNDEIMSFSRIWTGFDYQQARGNVEEASWSGNRHDPMKIQSAWRDKFPKTDLTGGYIGDGFPLCVDLPEKMFLRKGAKYRLLGSSHSPELMEDHYNYKKDYAVKRFVLQSDSELKNTLCKSDGAKCNFKTSVTLDANLECAGNECLADTVRVVEVGEGIFYEYVRPPCVEQAFYNNAKKVIFRERWSDSSCANPMLPYASEACCSMGDLRAYRSPDYLYDGERVKFSSAESRCLADNKLSCDFNDIGAIDWWKKGYHWTTDKCKIQVKVNAVGQVALVYEPEDYAYLHPHIRDDNRNFFKVYWSDDYPKNDDDYPKNDSDAPQGNSCGNGVCQSLVTGGCLCDTVITESRVFGSMPRSVREVTSKLTIGAYDPAAYDPTTYVEELTENDVTAYLTSAGSFDTGTVFEVTDEFGRVLRFKNTKENVRIEGASEYTFRNAPSFMSVLNTEADVRDAEYETQAALDHYLYHDNTAPFIAIRLIQRFTTSNPNPRYVKEVATAFRTGKYGDFGKGMYGDLAATIAAVLLDPEARSVTLDVDPFHGSLREPLLRVMSLMRSMEIKQSDGEPVLKLIDLDDKIGQMSHSFPTVFSFFLPEYAPDGRPGDATLVGPETMIMDMPKMVGLLNGMFSLVKYGLSTCDGGFGTAWNCNEGDFSRSTAYLSFSMPGAEADAVVSKLSTLLTSGRLSAENKQVIIDAYNEKLPDADAALRLAQQLILTSPEFHSTNTVKLSGNVRGQPELPEPSGVPYKAIVYVMFGGGCDSYNMLVPHTCTGEKDMYEEYLQVREEVALTKTELLEINATSSNQICESFGVHPQLKAVQGMYNEGDLLFFTNTGVLTKETDKQNYWRDTETQLFAHNWMQREAQRVDPLKEIDGTGVLGRISDVLTKKGRSVGTFSIEGNSISLVGQPGVTAAPFILSRSGVTKFNNRASSDTMDAKITSINEATKAESGVFGDLWSETLLKSLSHNTLLYDTLADKTTTTEFPPRSYLGSQLEMVAKMIDSRVERGVDADMFFLSTGGWDTHSNVLDNLNRLFADVDASFKAFADEMKVKGVWDSVTVVETSDFARTLNPNTGRGSDHAWGGNYMMFGGGVKGGQIVGTYPDNLTDDGDRSLGRGRMIPTTSWDAVFLPLAEWAGATTAEDLDKVCPNRDNFPESHFFDAANLFELNQD